MLHCIACGAPNPVGLKKCYHCKEFLKETEARRHRDLGDEILDEMERQSLAAGAGSITSQERDIYRRRLIEEGLVEPEPSDVLPPSDGKAMPRRVAADVEAFSQEAAHEREQAQEKVADQKRFSLKKFLNRG